MRNKDTSSNSLAAAVELQEKLENLNTSIRKMAKTTGKSHSAITQSLALLKLDIKVQELIKNGKLSKSHGRALSPVSKEKQYSLAQRAIQQKLSVRALEKLLKGKQSSVSITKDADTLRLERELSDYLGAPIKLVQRQSSKGSLIIDYNTLDELEGVLDKIGYSSQETH